MQAEPCAVQSSSENRACHAGDARPFGACVNGAAHIAAMVEFEKEIKDSVKKMNTEGQ